jgi:hypothetical protein
MSTIPASQIVNVIPGVLGVGGAAIQMNCMVLDNGTRVPIGTVATFSGPAAVASYFGANSSQAADANIYFGAYVGATTSPAALNFTQYPQTAIAAYLRGGNISNMTLAALQALSGSLTVVMDGYTHVISSISLFTATSFSNAALAIQAAFTNPTEASFTASIGGHFGTCTSSGTTLTLGGVTDGYLAAGDLVSGTDTTNSLPAGCYIVKQLTGTAGGAAGATFQLSAAATPGNLTSCTVTGTSTVLDVTHVASGALAIGQTVTGSSVTAGTLITGQLTGAAGAVGTYSMNGAAQGVASESMTGVATAPLVTYDSTSGAFVVMSGITGTPSIAAFATGTLSASLLLTAATGAALSQGTAAAVPGTFMTALTQITQNWATFKTMFDPDGGSGNSVKLAFAAWTNAQNNRYAYVCADTDATPTLSAPATESLGYQLQQLNYSGTYLKYEPAGGPYYGAIFICGVVASINFAQTNGRITFAFRAQAGLLAGVSSLAVAQNLIANGYNYYGVEAAGASQWINEYTGSVSGPFLWFDSYINQIQLNVSFQQALMNLLINSNSMPYNVAGDALIEQALQPVINAAGNFGTFRPGILLSASQITSVNNAAGVNAATVLQTRGWYLQVNAENTAPNVRAARGTPPSKFWYVDGESIQAITLNSIVLQ